MIRSYRDPVKPVRSFLPAVVAAAALAFTATPSFAKESTPTATASSDLQLARSLNRAFVELAEQVAPSVVVINVETKNDPNMAGMEEHLEWLPEQFRKQFREQFQQRPNRRRPSAEEPADEDAEPQFNGEGSGVIIREEGYVLTNNHVVENASKIRVRLKDGREFDAEVRGLDPQSDLAVIKLKGPVKDLVVAKFADSDQVHVGEFAIAVGAPFHLDYSVTFGHVSAKGRDSIAPTQMWDQQFIQTDARINPGNSGGPLVNVEGEVIGINSMIRGLESGIGFAIPSNLVREVADRLITDGKFTRSYLGIEIRALRDDPRMKDVAAKVKNGVVVQRIQAAGPAANSKLETFDVITAVDGKPVASVQGLRNEISRKRPNSEVSLNVYRGGENLVVKVRPEVLPESVLAANRGPVPPPSAAKPPTQPKAEYLENLGLKVEPLNKQLIKENQLDPGTKGVLVQGVEENSVAARNGVKEGDVICRAGDKYVTTVEELDEILSAASPNGRARISIIRDGNRTGLLLKQLPKK